MPSDVNYIFYSLGRSLTILHNGRHGQGAFARLWPPVRYNNSIPHRATIAPTPFSEQGASLTSVLYNACA